MLTFATYEIAIDSDNVTVSSHFLSIILTAVTGVTNFNR